MSGQYILDGKEPIACNDLMKWGRWFETANRTVAKDTVGDVNVSTVFLGLDHRFGGSRPMLFETMVFGGPLDQEQDRYSTWEEAEAGHKAMLDKAQAERPD